MELADNPKLDLPSFKVQGFEGEVDSGKISVCDETNGLQYPTKPESFVIDIGGFSNSSGKEISQNSRITRNFSRKGLLRGSNKITPDHALAPDTGDSVFPIAGSVVASTLEKQEVMGSGSRDQMGGNNGSCSSAQSHQIAITTGHAASSTAERCSFRRSSFKRASQPSWYLDPRKVFLFCATLSCVGTMLLIYFAFSSGMLSVEESELDY